MKEHTEYVNQISEDSRKSRTKRAVITSFRLIKEQVDRFQEIQDDGLTVIMKAANEHRTLLNLANQQDWNSQSGLSLGNEQSLVNQLEGLQHSLKLEMAKLEKIVDSRISSVYSRLKTAVANLHFTLDDNCNSKGDCQKSPDRDTEVLFRTFPLGRFVAIAEQILSAHGKEFTVKQLVVEEIREGLASCFSSEHSTNIKLEDLVWESVIATWAAGVFVKSSEINSFLLLIEAETGTLLKDEPIG